MENIINAHEKLFSYGTLRYETVQLSTFGRKLNACVYALVGYKLSQLQILDPDVVAVSGEDVHPILVATNDKDDQVPGMVFDVTLEEIMLADQYEVADYCRVKAKLVSGDFAWVYVSI